MMYNKVIFLATCLAVIQASETQHCASPQYARYNEKFILKCDIQHDVKGVYWYESVEQKDPFIKFENDEITGRGYDSGEYNMLSSGALVINNVTWKHDGIFKLLVLDQLLSIDNSFVQLEVIVEPNQVAPSIDECKGSIYCSLYVEDYESLQCAVQGARPALQLQWFLTQADGEDILQFDSFSILTDEGTYNSSSSIIFDQRIMSQLPSVLTCIASGPALALSTKPSQSSVLLESSQSYEAIEFTKTPIGKVYVEEGNPAQFPCKADLHESLVIWRAGASKHTLQTIGYSFLGSDAKEVTDDLVISGDGTLLLHNVSMSYEGLYVCLVKQLDLTLGFAYQLVVLVPPSPSFPVILDCFGLTCNRTVAWEGTLECTVYNVHPDVDLFLLTKSSITRLGNQSRQKTVDEENKLSTVSVQATYSIADALCGEYIPIACQASGPASVVFNSTANIKITKRDCTSVDASTSNLTVIWMVVPVGILMLIVCGCFVFYFKLSKGEKLVQTPTITKWQTRSYFLQFPLTREDVRMICDEGNLQRLCRMYEMKPEHERQIMETKKDDQANAFLEVLCNHHSLCSVENVEKIRTEELSKTIKNTAKPFGSEPESITGFNLQGWTVDDITSLSTSDTAVSYHCPEKTCSMILIGNESQLHLNKHFPSSRVNAFRFLCALEDNKLISCCESKVVKLQSVNSNHSSYMIDTKYNLKKKMENRTQRLWGISYNRSSKKVAIGVENDNKIFLFDVDMNLLEELRVEKTKYWPQHFATTSYIGNEYITLCTWPQNNVMCYNPKIKLSNDFTQIEGTLWAKHICCGTDGLVYVLFSKTPNRGEKLPYILQYRVNEVNPIAKLENLHEDTCVITYADSGTCNVILTMDGDGNIERYSLPPTDEKTWKESKWKKLSTKKDPKLSFKEEEESLL